MPSRKGTRKNDKYKYIGHVEHYFNDKDTTEFLAWIDDRPLPVIEILDILLQSETRIKTSYSNYRDGYHISIQPYDTHSRYRGYTIGFSHTSFERVIQVAWYIHEVLLQNDGIALPSDGALPEW